MTHFLRLPYVFLLVLMLAALPAQAQKDRSALIEMLSLGETVAIMHEEGLEYGADLEAQLFPDQGGVDWLRDVSRIYDQDRLMAIVKDGFSGSLGDQDMSETEAFYGSELGQKIIGLEISARRAMLENEVEEAARARFAQMLASGDVRVDVLRQFIEANDLVEMNVAGAMNASYAFYRSLALGGAFELAPTEDEIMADVWAQEEDIRIETEDWIFAYLAMAYQPLSDAELETYLAYSQTKQGRRFNQAVFDAFDQMYIGVSAALGLAAAEFMNGRDI